MVSSAGCPASGPVGVGWVCVWHLLRYTQNRLCPTCGLIGFSDTQERPVGLSVTVTVTASSLHSAHAPADRAPTFRITNH